MSKINWKVVNQNLYCPECGDSAFISPETDGTEGYHTHRFKVSREHAEELTRIHGKPSYEELEIENMKLRKQLNG